MTDVNEQSFSAVSGEPGSSRHPGSFRERLAPVRRLRQFKVFPARIIPKIIVALRKAPAPIPVHHPDEVSHEIEHFAALTLAKDDDAAPAYVRDLLAKGRPAETIFLDFLAPAARLLGAQWETDVTDFVKVTLGVGRLQIIMRQLADLFIEQSARGHVGESALLTIVPGEQHSFGLSMAAEFFRRDGWTLNTECFASRQELTSLVRHQWFDVVGFSVSSSRRLDELKQQIDDIRRISRNRHVGIIIGGPMVNAQPDVVAAMGADLMSANAATAPGQAHGLVMEMKARN